MDFAVHQLQSDIQSLDRAHLHHVHIVYVRRYIVKNQLVEAT